MTTLKISSAPPRLFSLIGLLIPTTTHCSLITCLISFRRHLLFLPSSTRRPYNFTSPIHSPCSTIQHTFEQLCELDLIQNGRFLNSFQKSSSFSTETDIIDPTGTSIYISPQNYPSESPVPGPLNFSSAPRSSSSPSITIPTIDVTSFTTDYSQQSWLPTPPPQQPLAPNLNNNSSNNSNSVLQDFVLYPAQSAPQSQPPLRDLRVPAPSNSVLRRSAPKPVSAQNPSRRHTLSLQLQRHLQQQFSGSPVPDPRVTKLARSSTYWSPNIHHSSQHHLSPIPPSHAGTSIEKKRKIIQAYRRNMSAPNFQGIYHLLAPELGPAAHDPSTDTESDLFGLPSAGFTADMDSPFDLGSQLSLGFGANDAHGLPPVGTVSPQDLMFEHSFPPSASFTDATTPSFDSPSTFSQNPSPMFQDAEVSTENWASLFPDQQVSSEWLPSTEVKEAVAKQPASAMSPPLPAAALSSPVSATGSTRHSSVNGVSRARKALSPVEFDSSDPIAVKRARNTEAARKSRAKKQERQSVADARIAELEKLLAAERAKNASLQSENATLKANQ